MKAISISNGISALLTFSGYEFHKLPERFNDIFESVAGNLNEEDSIKYLAAYSGSNSTSSTISKATKDYGAAQEQLKQFLATTDKYNTFCGLGCVEYGGHSCWTLPSNRHEIKMKGLSEIETDVWQHSKV